MAAGFARVLSLLFVVLFRWVWDFICSFSRSSFLPSFLPSFHSFHHPLPLSPFLHMWQLAVSVSTSNDDWPHKPHVSLPSFWPQKYSSRHAWQHRVAKGVSPSESFELFLSLKWHHRDPAWLMSAHLYTLFYPAEYLKTFRECPWAGLGMFDWQSACYSTFPIVHVMPRTQVSTHTHHLAEWRCVQTS